jgi:GDP-mannose 6-dehydrogenase
VSAVCLARDGHDVVGCDVVEAKLALLRQGRSPIVEPGMDALVAAVTQSGRLRVTADVDEAVAASEVSLVCVGTPAAVDGTQELTAIRRLVPPLASAISTKQERHLIAVRSTLLPGTMETLIKPAMEEHAGKRAGVDFELAFVPEFLREGSSIADYDRPPFTIVGVDNERAATILRQLYGHLPAEFCVTSIRTAELLKFCCNAFHALKISFANEIARLAQALSVDPAAVMDLFCKDRELNLSAAYLRPGFAFGGPCLPKDVQALVHLSEQRGITAPLLSAILPSNAMQIDAAVERILRTRSHAIGLLGLSYKSGTDDLRTSPLVMLTQRLIERGRRVRIYDPLVDTHRLLGANRQFAFEALPDLQAMLMDDPRRIAAECDVLVVGRNDCTIIDLIAPHVRSDHVVVDLAGLGNPFKPS